MSESGFSASRPLKASYRSSAERWARLLSCTWNTAALLRTRKGQRAMHVVRTTMERQASSVPALGQSSLSLPWPRAADLSGVPGAAIIRGARQSSQSSFPPPARGVLAAGRFRRRGHRALPPSAVRKAAQRSMLFVVVAPFLLLVPFIPAPGRLNRDRNFSFAGRALRSRWRMAAGRRHG